MLRRLTSRVFDWWNGRHLCLALRRAADAESAANRVERRMAKAERKLKRLLAPLAALAAEVEGLSAESAAKQGRMLEALEEVRAELRLCQDVQLTGMADANRAMVEQTRALIAGYRQMQGGRAENNPLEG